jgi:putative transposase
MPRLEHFYGQNQLHYLTANTYRKARIFDSDRYKRKFIQTLDDLRSELGFRIIGYVLMPEHCHLLIWPGSLADPSQIMQKLNYMHNNPVRRGLVAQPGDWPWSSWRYYYLDDSSVLAMDRLP